MGCDNNPTIAFFLVALTVVWLSFTIWWMINTWSKNKRFTKPLQRIMILLLIFKTLCSFFSFLYYISCEGSSESAYWSLAATSAYTLYNTFIFVILILISKGFGITRDVLDRQEVTVVAMTMGAVYLGYSAYVINPNELVIVLIAMLIALFYLTVKYSFINIKALQVKLGYLISENVFQIIPVVRQKISMLKAFVILAYFYFAQNIFTIVFLVLGIQLIYTPDRSYRNGIDIFSEICDTIALFWIMYIFRSKDRGVYFNILVIGNDAPAQSLPPFLKAEIPNSNDEEELGNYSIVVFCPQEFDKNHPYRRLMIASPVPRAPIERFEEEKVN
ncbi:unnamed protein product [Blepharisma stoltei]|uniref:Uncharacterized protein n=1 Tax=Blepharisma stoltei TaxID=1481888 RepID=A0AAU9JA60_9CILI|nr:unnamed protein product [Blepharisma stoltei]